MNKSTLNLVLISCLCFVFIGCSQFKGNSGKMAIYSFAAMEPDWVRNGEPLKFEEQSWYPEDNFEVLLDSEVYLLGEYRGVQFFVERMDVRPYSRLYTKIDRNKFRAFSKKKMDQK